VAGTLTDAVLKGGEFIRDVIPELGGVAGPIEQVVVYQQVGSRRIRSDLL
jgi:hypothetical protein